MTEVVFIVNVAIDAFSMFHAASMLNWSLISLLDLMTFLFILYTACRKGEKLALILV